MTKLYNCIFITKKLYYANNSNAFVYVRLFSFECLFDMAIFSILLAGIIKYWYILNRKIKEMYFNEHKCLTM